MAEGQGSVERGPEKIVKNTEKAEENAKKEVEPSKTPTQLRLCSGSPLCYAQCKQTRKHALIFTYFFLELSIRS